MNKKGLSVDSWIDYAYIAGKKICMQKDGMNKVRMPTLMETVAVLKKLFLCVYLNFCKLPSSQLRFLKEGSNKKH